jgi:hypothetical protein
MTDFDFDPLDDLEEQELMRELQEASVQSKTEEQELSLTPAAAVQLADRCRQVFDVFRAARSGLVPGAEAAWKSLEAAAIELMGASMTDSSSIGSARVQADSPKTAVENASGTPSVKRVSSTGSPASQFCIGSSEADPYHDTMILNLDGTGQLTEAQSYVFGSTDGQAESILVSRCLRGWIVIYPYSGMSRYGLQPDGVCEEICLGSLQAQPALEADEYLRRAAWGTSLADEIERNRPTIDREEMQKSFEEADRELEILSLERDSFFNELPQRIHTLSSYLEGMLSSADRLRQEEARMEREAVKETAKEVKPIESIGGANPFLTMEAQYRDLHEKLAAGLIEQQEFHATVSRLELIDDRQILWRLHPISGKWLVHVNKTWIQADPSSADSDTVPAKEGPIAARNGDMGIQPQTAAVITEECRVDTPREEIAGRLTTVATPPEPPDESQPAVREEGSGGGRVVETPAESSPFVPLACQSCGAVLKGGKKFCVKCGASVPTAASQGVVEESGDMQWLTFDSEPPPLPGDRQPQIIHKMRPERPTERVETAEPPPAAEEAAPKGVEQPLPEAPQPWGFRDQSSALAAQAVEFLEKSGLGARTGLGAMLPRMVRATLLDKNVFREVASDASLQGEAWQVIIIVILLGCGGVLISSIQYLSASLLYSLIPTTVIQLIAVLARIWLTQVIASFWLKTTISFGQFFRAVAYAQSPVGLQIIPMVGQFIGLWSLITNTAAIRDITGCNTKNAAVLAIVGIIGATAAVSFAGPFVQTLLAIF